MSSKGEVSESHISANVSKGTACMLNKVSLPSCQPVSVFMDEEAIEMTSVENNVSQHLYVYVYTYVCTYVHMYMYMNIHCTCALIMCMFSFVGRNCFAVTTSLLLFSVR